MSYIYSQSDIFATNYSQPKNIIACYSDITDICTALVQWMMKHSFMGWWYYSALLYKPNNVSIVKSVLLVGKICYNTQQNYMLMLISDSLLCLEENAQQLTKQEKKEQNFIIIS